MGQCGLYLFQYGLLRRTIPWLVLAGDAFGFQQRDALGDGRNGIGARRADVVLRKFYSSTPHGRGPRATPRGGKKEHKEGEGL
mgnify:CR=1 FL=1